jgi:hypothetical protein
MLPKTHRAWTFVLFLSISVLLIPASSLGPAQEQKEVLGELKIKGDHIESLVLRHLDDWHTESFEPPFESKKIPVGNYRLQNIRLEGGYYCGTKNNITVSVKKDETAVFKIGAPLKSVIEAKRQGRFLVLDYKLLGIGGDLYRDSGRPDTRPCFTVYKGDKVVGSGKFEYG